MTTMQKFGLGALSAFTALLLMGAECPENPYVQNGDEDPEIVACFDFELNSSVGGGSGGEVNVPMTVFFYDPVNGSCDIEEEDRVASRARESIDFSCEGMPNFSEGSFEINPQPKGADGTSAANEWTLMLDQGGITPDGTYNIDLIGEDGRQTVTRTYQLQVGGSNDPTITTNTEDNMIATFGQDDEACYEVTFEFDYYGDTGAPAEGEEFSIVATILDSGKDELIGATYQPTSFFYDGISSFETINVCFNRMQTLSAGDVGTCTVRLDVQKNGTTFYTENVDLVIYEPQLASPNGGG